MDTANETYVILVLAFMVFFIFYRSPKKQNVNDEAEGEGETVEAEEAGETVEVGETGEAGETQEGGKKGDGKNRRKFRRNNRYSSPYYTKPFWLFSNYHPYFNVYYDFYNPWSISSKECTIESLEKCKDNYYHEACVDSKYNECLREKTMFQSYYF